VPAYVTTGNLALVRQYVEDGWYPSGVPVASQGFVPMGALLKAVVINSGTELTGAYERGGASDALNYTSMPNRDYGFGRVDLSTTLVLDAYSPPSQTLYLDGDFEDMPMVDNWLSVTYEFALRTPNPATTTTTASAQRELKVTLVWHDPPAMPASRSALVNDLDLQVFSGSQQHWPNRLNGRDSVNNVEQVSIPHDTLTASGTFTVRVLGARVPLGPQPYALVVSGHDFELVNKTASLVEFEDQQVGQTAAKEEDSSLRHGTFAGWAIGGLATGTVLLVGGTVVVRRLRGGSWSASARGIRGMVGQPPAATS
jgi:hypothetical protein